MSRNAYVCICCGLRIAGRLGVDGLVRSYDQSATAYEPVAPCICIQCHEDGRLPPATEEAK